MNPLTLTIRSVKMLPPVAPDAFRSGVTRCTHRVFPNDSSFGCKDEDTIEAFRMGIVSDVLVSVLSLVSTAEKGRKDEGTKETFRKGRRRFFLLLSDIFLMSVLSLVPTTVKGRVVVRLGLLPHGEHREGLFFGRKTKTSGSLFLHNGETRRNIARDTGF